MWWDEAIKTDLDGHQKTGTLSKIGEYPKADAGRPPGIDKPVRESIGCLMWPAAFSRPDIAHALNKVQRHADAPTEDTWETIVKILSYLNATKDLGVAYVRGSSGAR